MQKKSSTRALALSAGLVNSHVAASLMEEMLALVKSAAADILIPNFGKAVEEQKESLGLHEPVTEIDRRISAFILKTIRESLPGSYSEEDFPAELAMRRRENLLWQFDPLDGTQEFIDGFYDGVAIQGALLARVKEEYLPVSGFIYRPTTQTLWYVDEEGELIYERQGKLHRPPELKRDGVFKGCVRKVAPDAALDSRYARIAAALGEQVQLVECGGAGASIIDILDGTADAIVCDHSHSKAWDIAMAIPLIEARGGFVSDSEGMPLGDMNAAELRNAKGFVASILYSKEELIPRLNRS
ncbi:MAG: hypothetical protein J0M12_06790 [Deltaproteobacteria bacterium]|nr:hypothetical protein [Deltaproteobacteria bacterium]